MKTNYQYRIMAMKYGLIYFMGHEYGYRIQVHFFGKSGYVYDEIFASFRQACNAYTEQCKKYGKEPNL